jgi:predicted NodU family carbamoyl transferase
VPAITHVDYSARIQTVMRTPIRDIIKLISKSFESDHRLCRDREHVLQHPRRADRLHARRMPIRCFMFTDMDALVLEDCSVSES